MLFKFILPPGELIFTRAARWDGADNFPVDPGDRSTYDVR